MLLNFLLEQLASFLIQLPVESLEVWQLSAQTFLFLVKLLLLLAAPEDFVELDKFPRTAFHLSLAAELPS